MLQTLAKKDDNAQSKITGMVFNRGRINQAVRQWSLLSFYETVYAKYISSDFTDVKQFISRPQTSSRYSHQALVIDIITKRARSGLCTGKYFILLFSFTLCFTACVLKQQDCSSDEKYLQPSLIYIASCLYRSQIYSTSLTHTCEFCWKK